MQMSAKGTLTFADSNLRDPKTALVFSIFAPAPSFGFSVRDVIKLLAHVQLFAEVTH